MTYDEAYKLAREAGARIAYKPDDEREVYDVVKWAEAQAAKGTMSDEEWRDRYVGEFDSNYAGPAYSQDILGTTPLANNKIRYNYKDGTSADYERQNDWGDKYGGLMAGAVQGAMTYLVPPMGVALGITNAAEGAYKGDWGKAAAGVAQGLGSLARIPGSEFANAPSGSGAYLGDMFTGMNDASGASSYLGDMYSAGSGFTPEELGLAHNFVNFGGEGALGIGGAGSTRAAGLMGNAALGVSGGGGDKLLEAAIKAGAKLAAPGGGAAGGAIPPAVPGTDQGGGLLSRAAKPAAGNTKILAVPPPTKEDRGWRYYAEMARRGQSPYMGGWLA